MTQRDIDDIRAWGSSSTWTQTPRKTLLVDSFHGGDLWHREAPKPRPYIEDDPLAWQVHAVMGYIHTQWLKLPERQRLYCPSVW